VLLEELADAALAGLRRERLKKLAAVSLLILDDLGMRKLPVTATEYRLELIMGWYERVSTLLTSNRSVAPWASGAQAALSACEEPNFPDSMSVSKSSAPRARRPRHARGIRPHAMRALLDDHGARRRDTRRELWARVMLQIWMEDPGCRSPAAAAPSATLRPVPRSPWPGRRSRRRRPGGLDTSRTTIPGR
jgi:hypothetical protein